MVSNDILKILNRKVLGEEYKLNVGTLVYVCDLLQAKNPHSLIHALARITHVAKGGSNYQLRLLNNRVITQHLYSLVPTTCNTNYFSTQTIDIFCLPTVEDTITPSMTKSKFDCYMDTFNVQKSDPLPNETDQILPVTSDVEQNSRFDLSRTRDLRDDVSSRVSEHNQPVVPSVPPSVPAIEYLPSPEEEKT